MRSALLLAAMMLAGCQSMAQSAAVAMVKKLDEEAFAYRIDTAPLTPLLPSAVAAMEPEQSRVAPPARTDVRGVDDGSMKVGAERVVITGDGKPRPYKVADFSREQLAALVCSVQKSGAQLVVKGQAAWRATVAARTARLAYDEGRIKRKEADAAEEKREKTLTEFFGPNLRYGFFVKQKKSELPKPVSGSLTLENVDAFTFVENGKEVMAVSGVIRNTGKTATQVPPITLNAIDRYEWILAGQTWMSPVVELAPGEAKPFEIRFINPPDTTAEIYAHFAPPFEYRGSRDCDGFDPEKARAYADEPASTPSGPLHTPAELNALVQLYRRDAAKAWNCRYGANSPVPESYKEGFYMGGDGLGERRGDFIISISVGKPDMARYCAPYAGRPDWRSVFALAEAADEAWGAAIAGDAARRLGSEAGPTRAEIDTAERLRALAQASLDRAPPVKDVVVDSASITYAHEKAEGRWIDVAGRLTNTGHETREVSGLMVALVDRLDYPLTSIVLDKSWTLKPGETVEIKERLTLVSEQEPWWRVGANAPPRWRARIGAVGRAG